MTMKGVKMKKIGFLMLANLTVDFEGRPLEMTATINSSPLD